ncbi:hypothetical protein SP90_02890 [Halodesulfovibrio spirochaetisodalis]|uniref:Uncharacterized protein n=1 Tax=Halodesulfovibrio spirochaetisodalis TaxID=1560234 RepID=A0A1B7XL74_9BACT|nr:hypothetical protein SP90_02890 [Halodesulfovibrio spirochaetisodalis]
MCVMLPPAVLVQRDASGGAYQQDASGGLRTSCKRFLRISRNFYMRDKHVVYQPSRLLSHSLSKTKGCPSNDGQPFFVTER